MGQVIAILPAYNEEVAIGSVILRTRQFTDRVLVIDDCSTDRTAEVAKLAGAEVISHPINKGKKVALRTGCEAVKDEDIIVMLDSDGRHDPGMIPEIIDPIRNDDYDMVVGSWRGSETTVDKETILAFNKKKLNKKKTTFFAISSDCLKKIDLTQLNRTFVESLLSQAGKCNLTIKQLDFEENPDFNIFGNYYIGVVVPAYNEELLIEETISGIPNYVDRIYVIDDCSTDRTPEIVKTITDPRVVSVRHEKNSGVGAAIITGYKLALEDEMDIVAVMAGDNQMDPEQLPRLLMPIIEGRADYTKGNRLLSKEFRSGMSTWRTLGNAMLTMITKIGSGYWHIMDPQNGYAAISRQALEVMNLDSIYPYYGYCNDMLVKLNAFEMRAMDVMIPAVYGRETSSIKYSRYIVKVAPMIFKSFLWRLKTKYVVLDFHPLVLFYLASMVMVPAGVLFGVGILWYKIMRWPVSQNFPLLNALILLIGFQFLLFAMLFDMQADESRKETV